MQLYYLQHKNIDFVKWDAALQNCSNNLIYAESIYLNTMCSKWNAIVNEDWTYIMPIPIKRKLGFTYVPSIPFLQQLGIFSKQEVTKTIGDIFLNFIQVKVKLVDYNFNYANTFTNSLPNCNNYILDLQNDYASLKLQFKKDLRKDIAAKTALTFNVQFSTEVAIDFFKEQYQQRLGNITSKDYGNLKKLAKHYMKQQQLICIAALHNNFPVATALIWHKNNRLYNIANAINATGKKLHANHYLWSTVIEKFAYTNTVLDFEGSDVKGIADFYQQFGTTNQTYNSLHYNNLPKLIQKIKRI